nr:hypothetical protein B0A51_15241 [Rachicladosporium sp. CCFEE 5018]
MAPDINTLPTSPRAERPRSSHHPSSTPLEPLLSTSRRTSQIMGPPGAPASAGERPHRSPVITSHEQGINMPMRHPRPLTAAELYAECEKEQEAVEAYVNRLARELTALRAQTASVASNNSMSSSSTSASLLPVDITDPNAIHQMIGATHPTPSRRHRSSSSLSTRSISTPSTSVSVAGSTYSTQPQAGSTTSGHPVAHTSQSQASFARTAASGASLSRQPSASARSGASTPARQSVDNLRYPSSAGGIPGGGTLFTLPHRPSLSRDPSATSMGSTAAHAGTPLPPNPHSVPSPSQSPSTQLSTQSYTNTAAYRSEMEIVKAENESLRQRVRALERALRTRRRGSSQSDAPAAIDPTATARVAREPAAASPITPAAAGIAAWAAGDGGVGGVAGPRERSESQSTTASSRRGTLAVQEDEVKVGESAGSVGIGRGV